MSNKQHAAARTTRVYERLKVSAANGLPCPKNAALASSLGCNISTISKSLSFLEANGLIEIERGNNWRVVTICESGLKTARTE